MSWRDGGHDDEDDEPHGLHASESPTALSDYHNSVTNRDGTLAAGFAPEIFTVWRFKK